MNQSLIRCIDCKHLHTGDGACGLGSEYHCHKKHLCLFGLDTIKKEQNCIYFEKKG